MKAKTIGMLCLFMILALAASAYALPVNIEQVKLDGNTLTEGATNRLDIEKNQEYDVQVKLTALENIKNAELKVFVSGFEYSATDAAQDQYGPFNLDANSSRNFKLNIKFSDEFEEDNYLLRVLVVDRNNDAEIASYKIKIDVPRNSLKIEDVVFYPENVVNDGEALLASVRVENNGDRDQEDVRVSITVPELSLAATSYINDIEATDEEETEEMYMVIPECAEPGLHEAIIKVEYAEGHESISETRYINVAENKACVKTAPAAETPKTEGTEAQTPVKTTSTARKVLEIALVVLVVLLVIIGMIIGFSKLGKKEEEY